MHTTVTFRHIESSDAIRRYAVQKSERVVKYLTEPIEVHWVLSVEKFRHIAAITITANGIAIKGEEQTEDMYAAIDLVMSKVEKQMRKYKEKLKGHKTLSAATSGKLKTSKSESAESQPKIIIENRSSVKPMTLDEAVEQIVTMSNKFVVFADTHTDNINVLYKRKDGDYGLIETASR
ncbi:MAG: ribosome-associated translation inhibitor RaiA [Deltaproteobacteria bacterium]|nr:ribosome-associated translation inhibitor RaiA [Deltaproteobacteria bacterium]